MKKAIVPFIFASLALVACGGPSAEATSQIQGQKVIFDLNYEGAAAPTAVAAKQGERLKEPAKPTREGYQFIGWMDERENHIFDFNVPVLDDVDVTLKAYWLANNLKENVFEAEYCPCITDGQGMTGSTYSGGTTGAGLIGEDYTKGYAASNGFYVHFLYTNGNTLTFDLEADKASTDSVLALRLSGEYRAFFEINNSKWHVQLNGVNIDYKAINFRYIPPQGAEPFPFSDYFMGGVSLKQGANKLELITDNTELMYGTAASTAPMVDCVKLYSDAKVTWPDEKPENLDLL